MSIEVLYLIFIGLIHEGNPIAATPCRFFSYHTLFFMTICANAYTLSMNLRNKKK